ncbi:four-carbon acid sugar kinase family protein [Kineococcus radiotolerans]|uniref:Type III effector Hrp-dependent outers n=1 Tax=Kineococcus radiotolerans (strain ATCC BAA-149 / DSM 14245 / SRS30216) TaxID=266940 RepID=A6WAX3_KINRD|nr:four-carbon acid sugar kinase family protein [Kineococcus radiotolerans]ABS03962.1 type III effector Hrp-dependent outers [Kineococcus radiotolerans SRS30216 = ATCC BAA-149]
MIGAIADDFTGATDVAVAFRRAGLRVAVHFGVPTAASAAVEAGLDAVVVALKSRTIEPTEAVEQSLQAARWLQDQGVRQLYFKYCSTFDSTARGNIGPVADALLELTGAATTVVVPASPAHGRTQYLGNLFVGDVPLAESPMRHHPLTPMTDSNVQRLLQGQTTHPTALLTRSVVARGAAAVRQSLQAAAAAGTDYVVVDALDEQDLLTIGQACVDLPLLTGAAGLAGGLGAALAQRERAVSQRAAGTASPPVEGTLSADAPGADATGGDVPGGDVPGGGPAAVLAGSCSARTLEQLTALRTAAPGSSAHPAHFLDAVQTPDAAALAEQALNWYEQQDPAGPAPLIYSSQPPQQLRAAQQALGVERASLILEEATGLIARGLAERGVRRLVVAGGETSGAVVTALGVSDGLIGSEAAPGVPWIRTARPETGRGATQGADDGDGRHLWLLLKSGNFGDPQLLVRAADTASPASSGDTGSPASSGDTASPASSGDTASPASSGDTATETAVPA